MKTLLSLLFLIHCGIGFSQDQDPYLWVNQIYNPNLLAEHSMFEYQNLNGNVESVKVKLDFIGNSQFSEYRYEYYTFDQAGLFKKIEVIEPDGSGLIRQFYHKAESTYDHEDIIYFLEGNAMVDTIRGRTMTTTILQNEPDSVGYSSLGEVVYASFDEQKVYSKYDRKGRKIRDYVTGTTKEESHLITYHYKRNRVVKRVKFMDHQIRIKTTYWLDVKGNWYKAELSHSSRPTIAIVEREIVYF